MGIRLHRTKAIATGAAFVSATALAMTAAPAASAATAVPTVTVHMSASAITFSGGGATTADGATTLRAGRYRFHVVSKQGGHALQLVRFRNGYTPDQAQADFNDAFGGNVDAVQRIDNGVVFLGGASAGPKHPGDMVVRLRPAQLMAMDQNGDAARCSR